MTNWLSNDEQAVWRQWLAVNGALPAALNRRLLLDAGLSLQDFDVLVALTDSPEARIRVSVLAQQLDWERSRLSHHVKRMTTRGLVARDECVDDGRGAYVVLTTAGREAIENAAPDHVETVRRLVFDPLDEEDLVALRRITSRMLGTLSSVVDPADA